MARNNAKLEAERARTQQIYDRLQKAYPHARVALDYTTPLELLIATILAAQSTDARVNIVTPALFKKYHTPQDWLDAPREQLQEEIRSCGFFRQKARSIQNSCEKIIRDFGGEVPRTMEELVTLDGVGRKTANVVLSACFDTPGIIVDTHVRRLSGRLGLSKNTDPNKIEFDLMPLLPREKWAMFSHLLVFHGRAICVARAPKCAVCPVNDVCPYPKKTKAVQ